MNAQDPKSTVSRYAKESVNQSFKVNFDYPVHFTRKTFDPSNPVFAETLDRYREGRLHRVAAVIDQGLLAAQPDLKDSLERYFHDSRYGIEMAGSVETFPGGPRAKTGYDNMESLIWRLGNLHLDRQSYVLALGGGSMLDAVGLAVSLVHRGLRMIRMPSTTLAQCDAGIGVKNGIDEHGQKNFLGTFAPPFAVINDLSLLKSLDYRHWRGGIPEAFKVALIRDRDFFSFLCNNADALRERDTGAMEHVVHRCAGIHLEHIAGSGDPFEMGSARPLDFGHWSAHRLEILSEHRLSHGEAVSIGIALDCFYAGRAGLIEQDELHAVIEGLHACGLPLYAAELGQRRADGEYEILQGLSDFREHLGGRLTLTLPRGIGAQTEINHVNTAWMIEGIEWLREQAAKKNYTGGME
jgi:3-dehydroquinate synthase